MSARDLVPRQGELWPSDLMQKTATFSMCKEYRYGLKRRWGHGPMLPVVMLNPSTADAEVNDPTVTRCIGFARREGAGGLMVGNLFGLRSTDPIGLKNVVDPFGAGNAMAWLDIFDYAKANSVPILCAWGVHGTYLGADALFLNAAREQRGVLVCLGKTKDGRPRHPLYVRGDQPLETFP